jgi:hypothetical protein
LTGKSLRMIFTSEDLERGLNQHEIEVARKVGRAEDDRWHVPKEGGRVFCHGILTCLKDQDAGVAGLVKVFRDRTDIRTQTETPSLAQLHGGIVEVQSGGPGGGSGFTLKLPLVQSPDSDRSQSRR